VTLFPPSSEPLVTAWEQWRIDDVLSFLIKGRQRGVRRPWVVAVDGRSASGKSTLAARLARRHPASTVIHTDDVAWYLSFFGWDHELIKNVLVPAGRGVPVAYRPDAWDERGREGAIVVPTGLDLLIVEGVGSSRHSITPFIDAVVWVQSDDMQARTRGIERDSTSAAGADGEATIAFWDEWDDQERPFMEKDRPWIRADLIAWGTPHLEHDPDDHLFVVRGPLH
jgi:hypothetical protein